MKSTIQITIEHEAKTCSDCFYCSMDEICGYYCAIFDEHLERSAVRTNPLKRCRKCLEATRGVK